jgi:hypothetical protein
MTAPPDPASEPERPPRPVLSPLFWAMMLLCMLCMAAALISVAVLPKALADHPTASRSAPAHGVAVAPQPPPRRP